MEIYTYQIAKWRSLKDSGIELIDTTVKSGFLQLAPRWDMVLGHKQGTVSDQAYTQMYLEILNFWWDEDPMFFEQLQTKPRIALGCYCRSGVFCHRHLLKTFLCNAFGATDKGEL